MVQFNPDKRASLSEIFEDQLFSDIRNQNLEKPAPKKLYSTMDDNMPADGFSVSHYKQYLVRIVN